ncbi:hypothetical protein AB2B38_001685 [Balneola sp. MJW-20]|uniref:hypothetical protein n=1 Tax=Gracilimonas aurantiaca TaxID=3234185 RepID=UPI00390B91A3
MVKKINLYTLLFIAVSIYSCDSVNNRDEYLQSQGIEDIMVSPSQISFSPDDGDQDTTVTFEINAILTEDTESPILSITNSRTGIEIFNGVMNRTGEKAFSYEASINTRTTDISDYTVIVALTNKVYAQSSFRIQGFANSRPRIISVTNPSTVTIPNDDSVIIVPFSAKVTDDDGQESISNVYLNFRNEDGSLLSEDPFILLDDGDTNGDSGDETAGDSTFTVTFSINSSNTPNNRTALYWSVDQSGLSSDTLTAPFNIIE